MKQDFSPVIWPEEKVPEQAAHCQKCELHCQRSRIIWGEGNPKAPILVLLDNPGAREDKSGIEFVCGTRQTLQRAVFEAGLQMRDLYVTYVLKCRPLRRYDKETARSVCIKYLVQQIDLLKPMFVFCLGNTATQWFFGEKDAEVKNLRGTWHFVRGYTTTATYHPLAIRRRPNLYPTFLNDWKILAKRYFKEKPLTN